MSPKPDGWRSALFLTLALILPTTGAEAQPVGGIVGGLSLASLEGRDVSNDLDSRTGFVAGAYVTFPIADIVAFEPGAYFVQKGASAGDGTFALSYLQIPLLASFNVATDRPVGLRLFLGPSVAFEMACTVEGQFFDLSESADCDDVDSTTEGVDFSAFFGGGLTFRTARGPQLVLNAGMDLGLRSIDGSDDPDDVNNFAVLITAGVQFPLTRSSSR